MPSTKNLNCYKEDNQLECLPISVANLLRLMTPNVGEPTQGSLKFQMGYFREQIAGFALRTMHLHY